ncbi:MAG: glycoside hydrolase family 10 protein [Chitinophagaceae bacterium]
MQLFLNRLFLLIVFWGITCRLQVQAQTAPKRELRAAWIATVGNIDWPSRPGLSSSEQQQEFITLLDRLKKDGMNAVVVQVRPAADAFFPSAFEPWSYWLTGKQGLPPDPYYDPLAFMIAQTHLRGMEFHAWINPYRAVLDMRHNQVAFNHITRIHPKWFLPYGHTRYFNPGLPQVWHYLTNLVTDIVKRYDVDAIHFDDYFYPYRISGKDFPDQSTFRKYGHGLSLNNWRRHNVDTVIEMISVAIKKTKPWVKFGISPFGVWRNMSRDSSGSDTRAGQTDYDDLYANVLRWLRKGWIDYVAPQLYWEFGFHLAGYATLLDWWAHHTYGRALYIGQGLYRLGSNQAWRNPDELPHEITANRSYPQVEGSIYFSASNFTAYSYGFEDSLRNHFYRYPALVPTMPWIDSIPPLAPHPDSAIFESKGLHLFWTDRDTLGRTTQFVIYRFDLDSVPDLSDPSHILAIVNCSPHPGFLDTTADPKKASRYLITSLDRLHNESPPGPALDFSPRSGIVVGKNPVLEQQAGPHGKLP